MKKREAQFGQVFRHWLKTKKDISSSAFELKQTTTNSLPFNAVKEHQIDALLACKSSNGLLFKIPDTSIQLLPFDMFYLKQSYAYVVIRYPKLFVVIDVDDFIAEDKESKRRSLTSERAQEIAIWTVPLIKR